MNSTFNGRLPATINHIAAISLQEIDQISKISYDSASLFTLCPRFSWEYGRLVMLGLGFLD